MSCEFFIKCPISQTWLIIRGMGKDPANSALTISLFIFEYILQWRAEVTLLYWNFSPTLIFFFYLKPKSKLFLLSALLVDHPPCKSLNEREEGKSCQISRFQWTLQISTLNRRKQTDLVKRILEDKTSKYGREQEKRGRPPNSYNLGVDLNEQRSGLI